MIKKYLTIAGLVLALGAGIWHSASWINGNVAWSADLKATNDTVKALKKNFDYMVADSQLRRMQVDQRDLYKDYPKPDKAPPAIQRQMKELEGSIKMQEKRVLQMQMGVQ